MTNILKTNALCLFLDGDHPQDEVNSLRKMICCCLDHVGSEDGCQDAVIDARELCENCGIPTIDALKEYMYSCFAEARYEFIAETGTKRGPVFVAMKNDCNERLTFRFSPVLTSCINELKATS